MNTLKEALSYLEQGFSVIPIGQDKKSLIGWKKYQTKKATEEQIQDWFKRFPGANVGIVTGSISGIVVVDVEKGGGVEDLPPTVISKTGGGGWHYYYKHPGFEVKNSTRIRELTDIRGDGGYIVAPPSLHKSGNNYEWAVSPDMADFAELPVWVLEKTKNSTHKKTSWNETLNKPVPEGHRNTAAAQFAGKLLHDLSPELWESSGWVAFRNWNESQNKPPLEEKELRNIWESIKKYHVNDSQKETTLDQCNILLSGIPKDTPKESMISALEPLLMILASNTSQEEAELYIRNKVKTELDIKMTDIASIIKYFKKIRNDVLLKIVQEKKEAEQFDVDKPLSEQETQLAENILKSPVLLYDVLKMVKKLGAVGEEKNILLHYIILTSRKLKQPLSATVKGDSSSGKSYTLLTTMKLFPKSAYIDLTDASPQSFFYCPENHFKHKTIVIFEKHGGERADYAIRTLQSEGKLKIQVTIKNPDTGQFEAQIIEKEGPTGFVTTTTASLIHSENDTRNISMFPDQSAEQTIRVYESVDSRYRGVRPVNENELKPWHDMQLILEEFPVLISFASSFRKYFPERIVRTRRDYGHFLAIVETVAFLHQKQREKIELHGKIYIRATLADAFIAKTIVEDSLSKSIYELPEKTIEVVKKAKLLIEELKEKTGQSDFDKVTFTITQLAKKLGWDRDTVAKWMKPASKKGYLTVAVSSKGPKGAEYILEEKELPGNTFLPSVNDLAKDNPSEDVGNVYNPLTGEIVSEPNTLSTDAPTESRPQKNDICIQKNVAIKSIGASVENVFLKTNL